jgi:cell division protein FtsA
MARQSTVGIDIGTYQVRVAVANETLKNGRYVPVIAGVGHAPSRGIRQGYVVNPADLRKSLRAAITQAEESSGISIKRAFVSVGGIGLEEFRSRAEIVAPRAHTEITENDVNNAIEESERKIAARLVNRKVLHVIPLAYKIDGQPVLGRPQGMKGNKLEVETLFVTTIEQHLLDLISVVEDLGIAVTDVMASPLAASFVTLSKAQKIAGCVLANIGAETVSVVVFENNIPISVKVFPSGSTEITNQIALELKVSLEDAEKLKRGSLSNAVHSKKHLDDIILRRLQEMFSQIESHLDKLGKSALLPAGIIITGGGSGLATVEDIARAALKLPSKRAALHGLGAMKVKDSSWAVAYGLCIWGMSSDKSGGGISILKDLLTSPAASWLKQFLP